MSASSTQQVEQAELSKRYQDALSGQRLVTALFTTFNFDPGFFEQEVMRLFFDVDVSHSRELRLCTLEDALRELPVRPAVYYDAKALCPGDVGSAKLDIARHPMRLNGCFHPKLVCALTEASEADEEGYRPRQLLVGCQSGNLTRAGWWENVEACHLEVIKEGTKSSINGPLQEFLRWLAVSSPAAPEGKAGLLLSRRFKGEAVGEILTFLEGIESYTRLSREPLAPRFVFTEMKARGLSITDQLFAEAGQELRGLNLEIISPYFNEDDGHSPLDDLIGRFEPKELRLYLPRHADGTALVSKQFHDSVLEHYGPVWGSLPPDILRSGTASHAAARFVHAKVYRFFSANPKREIWFVSSANLTRAAHQPGGNMECGFLVERDLKGWPRPGFLVEPDSRKITAFEVAEEPLDEDESFLTGLTVRHDWSTSKSYAHWGLKSNSSRLKLSSCGLDIGGIGPLPPGEWQQIPPAISKALENRLESSSFVTVADESGASAQVLVMEEGMTHKPSLLHQLSASDILRYWSMLTAEQRSAFLAERIGQLLLQSAPDDFDLKSVSLSKGAASLFDRFAGYFHAFHTLENSVKDAVDEGRLSHAVARLFGKKHDSIGHLLDRLEDPEDQVHDEVDRYVIVMCARQSVGHLRGALPEFWAENRRDATALSRRIDTLHGTMRARLTSGNLDPAFLGWFEKEFLRRESSDSTSDPNA